MALQLTSERRDGNAYTITLAPGVVRYLDLYFFCREDVERWIDLLRDLSPKPQIKSPPKDFYVPPDHLDGLNFKAIDELFPDLPWEDKLRTHYLLGQFYIEHKVPSRVYCCFHSELGLKGFALDECLNAWVRAAWRNGDVTASYDNSNDYIKLPAKGDYGSTYDCIFSKTPFVTSRLAELEHLAQRAIKNEQRVAAEKRARDESERLRKSQFRTFIYVMEDLRNGHFKIGRSTTPEKRERTLQSEVPQVVLRLSIPADEKHEKELHDFFENKRVRGEWFTLCPDDLLWLVSFLKKHGDATLRLDRP